ncbi:MAG: hypothetical protein J7493_10225 [Porphyrobacter sp.]|nr:hypothetical protein [Porphyrobacter sp.]
MASKFTPVRRKYLIRSWIVGAVYVSSMLGAGYLIGNVGVSRPVAVAVALVPGFAIAAMFYVTMMMISDTKDEFMRMLAIRQQLVAAGFAFSIASVWGCLEVFHLVRHMPTFYVVILWAIGVFVGQVVNRITYGVWGECP